MPGFDPFPARRYRELYRSEGAEQARISGYDIVLKKGEVADGWQVTAEVEGVTARTRFETLTWSDIVRTSMAGDVRHVYGAMARTVALYVGSGAFGAMLKLRKGPVIVALYPVAMLVFQALVALALGIGVWRLAPATLPDWGAPVMGGGVAWLLILGFRALDRWFYVYYLMQDYAYGAREAGAYPVELSQRIAQFAERLREALAADVDEVLVVGHSSGAHIAVSALALVLRDLPAGPRPQLGFLSLGQVAPMISFLPKAQQLRQDLELLGHTDLLCWVDVSAPGDGCTFALCDPVAVTGLSRGAAQTGPLVLSAAFSQTLSPERWRALRWRFLRLHFQYLCAFDAPGDYDYFQITAGPRTLADRFAARRPSVQRIVTPVSPHRDTLP